MNYSFWQRLRVWLFGRCYLEHRTCPGGNNPLPFYLAVCPEHGYFEDYPHGWNDRLNCLTCLESAH